MPKKLRRILAVALTVTFLLPDAATARVLDTITLPKANVTVKGEVEVQREYSSETNPATGNNSQPGAGGCIPEGSPGLNAVPIFHTGNNTTTVWGRGWSSDIDQFIELDPEAGTTVTWQDGGGGRLLFSVANSEEVTSTETLATPIFRSPINTFQTLETIAHSLGMPTSLLLKDPDGTNRLFTVAESTSVLRLSLLTDKNGNSVAYTRDGQGRLTHVQDVHGRYVDIAYGAGGFVSEVSDSGGRASTYGYDAAGRKLTETGFSGTIAYEYDALNRRTKITYPNGGVKNYTYDASNRILTENDGAGVNAQSYAYHASSTVVTDALGRKTIHEFINRQGMKKPSRIIDAHGGVTKFEYDADFNLSAQTDPLGRVTHYEYDAKGNVTTTVDPAGGITRASYEPSFSLPTQLTDPLGRKTLMSYDSLGNQVQVTDPLSNTTSKDYDGQGHVTLSEDPLGHSTLFSYEPTNGALKTITDPLIRQTVMITDALSRVTQNTDPASKVTGYQYDTEGNLTKVTDAFNHDTLYGYQAGREKKQLHTVTDANSHTTTFGYDPQGRLTSVTNAENQTKTSQYNTNGTLKQTTNARGQTISYTYDALDRVTKKTTPEGSINYAYDAAGRMTDMKHYNGSRIQTSYDANGRVSQAIQTLPNGYAATIGYSYDAAGNRTSMTTPWGGFSYQYDALNRLTSLTNPQSRTFAFAYDANGRRTALNFPNGIQATYGYDDAGQILSIIHTRTSDGDIVAKSIYEYDNGGNRTSMTDLQGRHSYTYDDLDRLTQALHPVTSSLEISTETFSYDNAGNRLADARFTGYTYDGANRIEENSAFTYGKDADGNRTSIQNKLTGATTFFGFNSENQITAATRPNNEMWNYKYDQQGRRVEKSSGTSSSQKVRFIHDGDNIMAMLDGGNNPLQVYTMSLTVDEALSRRSGSGTERFFHSDALGNVRSNTSTSAAIVESYEYAAYGLPTVKNSIGATIHETAESHLLYTGRFYDEETGLQNNRRRTYDPLLGIFITEDPTGIEDGPNVYRYANANPLRFSDPYGTQLVIPLGPAAALLGIAGCVASGACQKFLASTKEFARELMCEMNDNSASNSDSQSSAKSTSKRGNQCFYRDFIHIGDSQKCIYDCIDPSGIVYPRVFPLETVRGANGKCLPHTIDIRPIP